jgi:adenylylsulfate kinase
LYKKARNGEIKGFTGIDSPFEAPEYPDIHILTEGRTIEESTLEVMTYIRPKINTITKKA